MASLSVDIKNTEVFKNLADLIKILANDKRIPAEVREEIISKYNGLLKDDNDCGYH